MAKKIKKALSALLTAAVLTSTCAAGVSVVGATPVNDEGISQTVTYYAPDDGITEVVDGFTPPDASEEAVYDAASDGTKVGEFRTIGYENTIYTLDDYILALKRTYRTNDELKSALNSAEKYVDYVDNTKSKYFPKIRCQWGGTCVAWSCIYYNFTNAINKMLDREATDEHTFQPMFLYNIYNGCNLGRHIENLLYTTGCAPFSMVPAIDNDTSWNAEYDI